EGAAPAPSGVNTLVGPSAPPVLGNVSVSSRFAAAASPISLSPSPPPASPRAAGREAVDLPPAEVLPKLRLDYGRDNESRLDFSDEHASDEEEMQLSLDVRPRATSPPATSRTLGQQLHEVALGEAVCFGLPLPTP